MRVRALAWLLVAAGSAATAYPALAYGTGMVRQARLAREVATLLGPEARGTREPGNPAPRRSGSAGGPVAPRTRRADPPVRPPRMEPGRFERAPEGAPLGILEVPSIGLRAVVLEGVSSRTLLAGPGHLPGTALPGTGDVSVVAAHRDAHFRRLKDLAVGARVVLRLPEGLRAYRVVGREVVGPRARWVTEPRGRPILRLVTCWPPGFLGPAPDRLVVSAAPAGRWAAGGGPVLRPSRPVRWPGADPEPRRVRGARCPARPLGPGPPGPPPRPGDRGCLGGRPRGVRGRSHGAGAGLVVPALVGRDGAGVPGAARGLGGPRARAAVGAHRGADRPVPPVPHRAGTIDGLPRPARRGGDWERSPRGTWRCGSWTTPPGP